MTRGFRLVGKMLPDKPPQAELRFFICPLTPGQQTMMIFPISSEIHMCFQRYDNTSNRSRASQPVNIITTASPFQFPILKDASTLPVPSFPRPFWLGFEQMRPWVQPQVLRRESRSGASEK